MTEEKYNTNNILATIVLYNTSLEQSSSFQSLSEALSGFPDRLDVLVYDNSPTQMYTGELYSSWSIHYYHDPANSGVSKAFNKAGEFAKALGKKWMLLLDQDTSFPKDTIQTYLRIAKENNSGLFAPILLSRQKVISPFKVNAGEGRILTQISPGRYRLDQIMPVNSGMMVNTDDFRSSGGYNENFPLDYSDFAFIERFKKIRPYFEVINLTCEHQFSGLDHSGGKSAALKRFKHFCGSTLKYKNEIYPHLNCNKLIIKRALRLTMAFGSLTFLKTGILTIIKN